MSPVRMAMVTYRSVRDLIRSAAFEIKDRLQQGKLIIVTYHRVLPREIALGQWVQPGMWVSPETFRSHLDFFKNRFQIVRLSDWFSEKNQLNKNNRNCLAITFDDGWRDNYTWAFPIIKRAQVPCTIFVVPGKMNRNTIFWPERLTNLARTIDGDMASQLSTTTAIENDIAKHLERASDQNSQAKLDKLICHLKQYPDEDIELATEMLWDQVGGDDPDREGLLLDWQQLEEMASSQLVEIGSHTLDHYRLTQITSCNRIRHQLDEAATILREKVPKHYCGLFCYPNGDYSDGVIAMVRELHVAACSTRKGWVSHKTDKFAISRISLHDDASNTRISLKARLL